MEGLRLHHVGIAVSSVEDYTKSYVERFGYVVESEVIHDPLQTAFVQFLRLPGESSYLEFVAPDGPGSKLTSAVDRGGGLNHLCYVVNDIEASCRELVKRGLALVQRPTPAVAFRQRPIAWLVGRDRVLFELVQRGPAGEL
jgi:methylmalonyl-CoA/ethylmalonyl-CoA epimerase